MPTYQFKDKNTGEVVEKFMKISERDEFVANNPNYETVFMPSTIIDPSLVGAQKPPSDFMKYIVNSIEERNPKANKLKKFSVPREW